VLAVIEAFMAARQLPGVTVAAEAGMISGADMKAIEAAGLSFILGIKGCKASLVATPRASP